MKQKQFIEQVVNKIKDDTNVIGLGVAGSYITNEIDEFSDVDLILVTAQRVADDVSKMHAYARSWGHYLNGFIGEHVGEKRVLICLYDNPLLHVDIKFLTLDEFQNRVENPVIVFERESKLTDVINSTKAEWPGIDYQWIEDRFWTWVHYATLKLGRGELFEALDFLSFVRVSVTSPMLQTRNGKLPRGLRKVEMSFHESDLNKLVATVPSYSMQSVFDSLQSTVDLYVELRQQLFPASIERRALAEQRTREYLNQIRTQKLG